MHVAVIGGGITGLAAAWFVRTRSSAQSAEADRPEVTVFEGSPWIGGKLRTVELAGIPVDVGAEAMLNRRPEAVELARAVGLSGDLRFPDTTTAGLWTRSAIRPIPGGTLMGIPGDLTALADSGLLDSDGLTRVARDLELPAPGVDEDVAIGTYAAERLGRELVDRLLEPLLGGVYAGHADELSLQATVPQLAGPLKEDGSLIRAVARLQPSPGAPAAPKPPVFAGLDGGVGRLPDAVAAAAGARIRTGAMVRELARTPRGWRLVVGPTREPEIIEADAVIIACPARPASRLLAQVAPAAAGDLGALEYASMATIAFAFDRSAFGEPLTGSGFLVPPVEARTIKAATYSSVKWGWPAERAPGITVVRCSVGRHREEAVLQREDGELAATALNDLRAATGVAGEPLDAIVTRWGGGLPQYAVGHRDLVARVRSAVSAVPGLAVAGAAYDGVGIPACIATAKAAADDVLRHVRIGV